MIRQGDCFLIPRLEGLCPLVHWLSRWFVAFAVITSDSESSTAQTHCQLESWRVHKMHEHLTGEVFRINQRLVVCFVFCFFIFPPVLNGVFSELHDCSYKSVLIIFLNECSLHVLSMPGIGNISLCLCEVCFTAGWETWSVLWKIPLFEKPLNSSKMDDEPIKNTWNHCSVFGNVITLD